MAQFQPAMMMARRTFFAGAKQAAAVGASS